jgi:hypothetical protein
VIDANTFGFTGPDGVSSDGRHVWVGDYEGSWLTEFPV